MITENDNDADVIGGDDNALSEAEAGYFASKGEKPLPEAADGDEGDPATATAKDAEQPPEAAQRPQDDDPDRKPVPYGALKQEREKRKALEDQLRQMQGTYEQRFARLQAMQEQAALAANSNQPKPEMPKGPPNPEEDFIGATQYALAEIEQFKRAQAEQAQRQYQTRQQQEFTNRVMTTWSERAQQAAREAPEFADAYRFVTRQRFQELLAAGVPEAQARNQARQDEFNLVTQALQQRRDPARTIYEVARARGFTPKQAAAAAEPAPQRLDNVARGMQANKSLSAVGQGTTGKASLDAKKLLDMSDDDFESFMAKNGAKGFKAAVGG
jgi:hypothetical protein